MNELELATAVTVWHENVVQTILALQSTATTKEEFNVYEQILNVIEPLPFLAELKVNEECYLI